MTHTSAHIALADYIRAKGIKKKDFAAQVGVRNSQLSRWLSGRVRPERYLRMVLAQVTEGAVPEDAWK